MQVTVNASTQYDVVIKSGALDVCGEYIRKRFLPCKIALLTDDNVLALYSEKVKNSLTTRGFEVFVYSIKPGEESKNLTEYGNILSFLAEHAFTSSDVLLSLGGGVVSDLGGFVASTYHRGIAHIIVPTTLLSAIDASVGGKTAVNLPAGKNLVGTFYQPSLVICDVDTFTSLGKTELEEGYGELCKYSLLSGVMFEPDKIGNASDAENMVKTCVDFKAKTVRNDEFDKGERRILNLGHTAAHAAERASDFKLPHGIAVYYGLKLTLSACRKLGVMSERDYENCKKIMSAYDISTPFISDVKVIGRYIGADKKTKGDKITLALLRRAGEPFTAEFTLGEAVNLLCE
ncbi:MAG: 3-dehydroquinate synthase [Firmicutes bacterium]|nr:3-dehydroquinate synthase [Bacillota bacterium]MDY5530769.1 3-dehydroquinate synthase [Pumilibacteraceae bacterium]